MMSNDNSKRAEELQKVYGKPTYKSPVFIVEDEADLAEEVGECLVAAGFRVVYSRSAPDATQKLENERFSCIVLDINLEKGTGDKLIGLLRNNRKHLNHQTPIVVTSGHLNHDLVVGMAPGVQGAYVKPYDIQALIEKIWSLVMHA